ncbi:MAG: arylsulfatase [Bacteroidales bacterium]|nr:arylsulfatase [Bacteroidales bacterium]
MSAVDKRIKHPNIIYILADDLGYGELGCYGQEKIETPHIDKLAQKGMMFTNHYAGAPVCAPSRCMLLTGKHSGHAYIRGNDEWAERGDVRSYKAMIADSTLEGQRPLPNDTKTIGRLLQASGYKTAAIGKWGLGAPHTEGIATKQGFDYFFGYNCQRQAHTYYPVHLYENEHRVYLDNDTVAPGTLLVEGVDLNDEKSYQSYSLNEYAPDLMFNKLTNFIERNKDTPFFLYWATPLPHAPIQAPQKWVDYYVKKFGSEKTYDGRSGYFPHKNPRAGYAAMVSYLDEQVGLLMQQLKDLDLYENTIVIFTSDNGPTYNGGTDSPFFDSGSPFKCEYGWGKGFLHEGGIRVPMIASWPGYIKENTVSDHVSAFWDVLPTLCELGRANVPSDVDGISFLAELRGRTQQKHDYLYWEFPSYGGQLAVRLGNMKAICKNVRKKNNRQFELYDLDKDPKEQTDVADKHPEVIQKVHQIVDQEHVETWNSKWKFKQLGDCIR